MRYGVYLAVILLVILLIACVCIANGLFEQMLTRTGLARKAAAQAKRPPSPSPEREAISRAWYARRDALLACPHEDWSITAADGVALHARCIPAQAPTDRWALCVHGYTSSGVNECTWFFDFYRRMGYHLLLPDNRAHGESGGEYVGMGVLDHRDIQRWIDELLRRTHGDCRIVLHGVSMGAATVTTLSGVETPPQVRGFWADCGYTSVWDEFAHEMHARYHLPTFPILDLASVVCRLRAGYGFRDFSPMDAVKQASKPMLFVHGGADDFVPTCMSRALFDACTSPQKTLLIIDGAVHAASYRTDPARYEQAARAFLKDIGMGESI